MRFQGDTTISHQRYLDGQPATDASGKTLPGPRDQRHRLLLALSRCHLSCRSLLFS